jgi:hypothetical protein
MTMHTLHLRKSHGIIDLFANAVPSIALNEPVYIQNITNCEVFISETPSMEHQFLIGGRVSQPEISIVCVKDNPTFYVRTERNLATLTIQSGV